MAVHVAQIGLVHVTATGEVKPRHAMTIGEAANASSEMRVLPHPGISATNGYPTIDEYLAAEENAGFRLGHIDQTFLITYTQAAATATWGTLG